MIPRDRIVNVTWTRGITKAVDTVTILHKTGGHSVIKFKSYEQGREAWQADTIDWVWFDEEPPDDVYSEGLARFTATDGMAFMTFTPLKGMSTVVKRFKQQEDPLRGEVIMTAHDAKHITPKMLEAMLAKYPVHEHECRINGVPMAGEGRIYQFSEEVLKVEPFNIMDHWTHIIGLDVGHGNHPTAAVWIAHDRDTDTAYLYKTYRQEGGNIPTHAAALRAGGRVIVAWPQDVKQGDRVEGTALKKHYETNNVWMMPGPARFPDDRGNSVWAGITEIQQRSEQGRLRVFSTCNDWFEEFRNYHLEDGKVVKKDDDLLDATRYAIMCLNAARTIDRNWYPGRRLGVPGQPYIAPGTDFDVFS